MLHILVSREIGIIPWKFSARRGTTTDSSRRPSTTINILHNKVRRNTEDTHTRTHTPPLHVGVEVGMCVCVPALLLGSASPGASNQLTSDPPGVSSGSHSPNHAQRYLPNIAPCPPSLTGIALNRQGPRRRSARQRSRLPGMPPFSRTSDGSCAGRRSCEGDGSSLGLRETRELVFKVTGRRLGGNASAGNRRGRRALR